MRSITFSLLFTVLLTLPLYAASPNLNPGQWTISSSMEMPGMNFTMPATSFSQCITAADLIPRPGQENGKCRVLQQDISGDTVTWTIACESGGGQMTSKGEVTYHGDTFEGTVQSSGSSMPTPMTQTMNGKRTGSCVK
jgi:hypothetical protein